MSKKCPAYGRIFLLLIFCLILENVYSQKYYVSIKGDTVYCEIKKEGPYSIKIKTGKKETMPSSEIKGYTAQVGEVLTAKKTITNKGDLYVLLPAGERDIIYNYSDGHVNITSDGVTTFYELITYGGPSSTGRDIIIALYIENKAGFSKIEYAGAFTGKKKREEIINTLKQYLGTNESITVKLKDEENIALNLKGIEKLVEEYFNKKLVN